MILLFDPDPPWVRWCTIYKETRSEHKCVFEPGWTDAVEQSVGDTAAVESIAYMLPHGGEAVAETVSLLNHDTLSALRKSVPLLPESNTITSRVAERWLAELPTIRHFLFCDTAFFANLPPAAGTYAVPQTLRANGVRRYGGFGLCHQRAWQQARQSGGTAVEKVVSVFLGDRPNVAAVRNARAVETTLGFTPVEGIMSSTSCGDVDPTIVFQLESTGMTFQEINHLLSRESGLAGLLGSRCSFAHLLKRTDPPAESARDLLRYQVLKSIGSFIAVLGGVDALVFSADRPDQSLPFVLEVCDALAFLGLQQASLPERKEEVLHVTAENSSLKAVLLHYDKWQIMADRTRTFPT